MENETLEYIVTGADNTPHPVLTKLYEQIATLEKKVEELTADSLTYQKRSNEISYNFQNYKYKLENVLRTVAEDNEDSVASILEIAEAMDIELVQSKSFEVTATFRITVNAPFGEDIELSEYDFSATLESYDHDFEVDDSDIQSINEL